MTDGNASSVLKNVNYHLVGEILHCGQNLTKEWYQSFKHGKRLAPCPIISSKEPLFTIKSNVEGCDCI